VINFRPPSITTSSFPLLLPSSPSLSSHHNQSTSSWFVGTFTIFLYHIERYFASTPSLQLLSDSDLFRFIATKPEPERCKIMSSPGHPQRSPDKIAPIFTAIIQGETPSGPLLASVSVSILELCKPCVFSGLISELSFYFKNSCTDPKHRRKQAKPTHRKRVSRLSLLQSLRTKASQR
jgi:hypothetical protein